MQPITCPYCCSTNISSHGKRDWICNDCKKQFAKHPKRKDPSWHQWNKGLTKESDSRIASYGKKISVTKKNNPKYRVIILKNMEKSRKLFVSIEEIKKLYYDEKLSQKQIAKKYNVSQGTILLFMRKHGLQARPKHTVLPNHFNSENLRKGYKKVSKALKGNTNWKFSHKYPNSEEEKLIRFFNKWNLPFKYVGDGSFKIDGKCPDFINEEKKLIIEFFGELWHENLDEQTKINFFKSNGWNCLVIWGKEIKGKSRRSSDKPFQWERPLHDRIIHWMAGL